MPSKKQTTTIALVAGGAVLAYLILNKKQAQPTTAAAPLPSGGSSMLQSLLSAAGAVKNLISPSGPSPAAYLPTASNPASLSPVAVAPSSPAPSPAADITIPVTASPDLLIDQALQPASTDQIAGFTEIPGTALAVLCGCACLPPKTSLGKFDYSSLILPAAVIVGGYFILKKVGIFNNDTSQNNASIASQTAQGIASSIAKEKANGGFQTVTDAQLSSLAADIWTKGITNPIDQDGIVWDTIQVNTLLDLLLLKQAFQTKNVNTGSWLSWCAIARVNCTAVDFDTFIKGVLDASHVAQINQFMSAQGINYSF